MVDFYIDKDNATVNTPMYCLQHVVVVVGALKQLLAYTTIGEGGRDSISSWRWDNILVAPNVKFHGKFFAIEGGFVGHHGQGHTVQIKVTLSNNIGAVLVIPTVPTDLAALAADITILQMDPIPRETQALRG